MKIELENFGIVKHFNYDTKENFSIIFGKNNTGKSYAISVVYLIIKNLLNLEEQFLFRYFIQDFDIDEKLGHFQVQLETKKTIDIKKEMEEILLELLSKVFLNEIQESFKSTFDSIENLQNKLTEEELSIKINSNLINLTIKIKDKKLYISNLEINRKKIELRKSTRNLSNKDNGNEIIIYSSNNHDNFVEKIFNFIMESSGEITFDLREQIKSIYYLPASRSGLYQALSAFGQIIAELSKSRKFTTKKIELPSISEPLSDYFLELSNIKVRKKEINNKITEIASEIESSILNGKIEFDKATKKIIFKPKDTELKLDLSYTSSMVSEISPIVSYLRYVINYSEEHSMLPPFIRKKKFENSKPLIIIEEPEAHLHPDVQIELLKQFVELAKNDVKFMITTHSNYMFNKFNNLVISKEIDIKHASSLLFKETKSGTDVINMELDEFGIEDENFIYTSENLYNEKMELIKQINQETN